jgi:hypothetical protein
VPPPSAPEVLLSPREETSSPLSRQARSQVLQQPRIKRELFLQPELITTRAPSLPKTPLSLSLPFGLRSRPFFLENKPNMPGERSDLLSRACSSTIPALWFAISLQLPCSLRTTCTPPPIDVLRVLPRGRGGCVRDVEGCACGAVSS